MSKIIQFWYDVTLKDFKNNIVKENAWAKVSAEVGVNGIYLLHASWCVVQKLHYSYLTFKALKHSSCTI